MEVSETTLKLLNVSIEKEKNIYGYPSTQIKRDYINLLQGNEVEVGYRAGSGKIDNTHKVFKEWIKIIKSLKKDGFLIEEKNMIHDNKSPTMAQGFWNSVIYKIQFNE